MEVCPTQAIGWSNETRSVQIDDASCIGCGLCAARCPYGAITLDKDGVAVVQLDDVDDISVEAIDRPADHPTVKRRGTLGAASPKLQGLPDVIASLGSDEASQFVRNVLVTCGIVSRVRRKGDQNVRIDGIFHMSSGDVGPIEIDLEGETLDALRALLEDVAVLHSRYSVPRSMIIPLGVLLTLPSARSEYYRVIVDIKKVTGLEFRTVTLGVLVSLMWQFRTVDNFDRGLFFIHEDQTSLLTAMKSKWPTLIEHQLSRGAYSPTR